MHSSSGMAVISLDLLSTAVWASTSRLASVEAPIRMQRFQVPAPVVGAAHALAVDGHDLHPVPEAFLEAGRVQPGEDPSRVACEGIPFGKARKVRSHSSLSRPKRAMTTKLSAPQMTASTRMSVRGCSLVRSTRKSSMVPMVSTRDGEVGLSMRGPPQAESGTAHCSHGPACPVSPSN